MPPSAMYKTCLCTDSGSIVKCLRDGRVISNLYKESCNEAVPRSHGIDRGYELHRLCIVLIPIIEKRTPASSCDSYDGSSQIMRVFKECLSLLI